MNVVVLERGPKKQARFDGRTLALSFHSMKVLRAAGVGQLIEKDACPILDIRIADQNSSAHLDFRITTKWAITRSAGLSKIICFTRRLNKRIAALKSVRIVTSAAVKKLEFADPLRARHARKTEKVFAAPLDHRRRWAQFALPRGREYSRFMAGITDRRRLPASSTTAGHIIISPSSISSRADHSPRCR